MIPTYRQRFNDAYTDDRYRTFRDALVSRVGVPIEFHICETPAFLPATLIEDLSGAARAMIAELLGDQTYLRAANQIVPERFRIPNGEIEPTFVCVDFGLLRVGDRIEGRLVELQAFPSLFGFQIMLAETSRDLWDARGAAIFPGGLDRDGYLRLAGGAIVGVHDPAEVVLMEIDPAKQKTRPDFEATERLWGVRAIDVREVSREGTRLFYTRDGRRTPIRRIYNRVIPDDLAHSGIELPFDYRDPLDVEWAGGPDWFFRISKFSIPWLTHPWVPRTRFLHDFDRLPDDREDWLLKPLFSYAGGGIIFAPTDQHMAAIPDSQRHLYVLQERVAFTPVIETIDGPTQAEIRLMFVREADGYRLALELVRMGRGKMMGVDHNKGLKFVGAAAGLIVN